MNLSEPQIQGYATCIYERDDVVELRMLRNGQAKKLWCRATDLAARVPELTRWNQGKWNVHIAPNPRTAEGLSGDENVALCRTLFADFDSLVADTPEEACRIVLSRIADAGLPVPTLVIFSGHGVHTYWRLVESIAPDTWHRLQARLNACLKSDAAIVNPERLMRWPGFTNHKDPNNPIACFIVKADPNLRYDLADIEPYLPEAPTNTAEVKPAVCGTIRVGQRDCTLTSLAGTMRRRGMSPESIEAALRVENDRCEEPLPDADLQRIARSIGKRGPATDKGKKAQIDPTQLALAFLGRLKVPGELRKWRGEYYWYRAGRFWRVSDETVIGHVTQFLQDTKWEPPLRVTRSVVNDTLLNLTPMIIIRETQELNSWVGGEDRGRVLPVKNGLLSLDTLELQPHTPTYFSTTCLPYDYDPDAGCSLWLASLRDIMCDDAELILLLQEWFGYLLRPDLRQHKFLLCVGEGSNGKNMMLEVKRAFVGPENCSSVPLAQFGDRFALGGTIGKVVNLTSESSHVVADAAENMLKMLASGDPITIERKFRDPVHTVPTAKVAIATNSLPRFTDRTYGTWRRILLVPFDRTFSEAEQVKTLAKQIIDRELPGILNWAIAGLRSLNRAGCFTVPQKCRDLMEEYRRDSDPARAFLTEHYTYAANAIGMPAETLYAEYREFCEANNYRPLGSREFGKQVYRIFPEATPGRTGPRTQRTRIYRGLIPSVSDVSDVPSI